MARRNKPFRSDPSPEAPSALGDWFPVRITGTVAASGGTPTGYTAVECWIAGDGNRQDVTGGRFLGSTNPGYPLDTTTAFAVGDVALCRSGPGAGGLKFELIPYPEPPPQGFFARLTSSSNGTWNFIKLKLQTIGSTTTYVDDSAETTGYPAVPIVMSSADDSYRGLSVWMQPSSSVVGKFSFEPIGYAGTSFLSAGRFNGGLLSSSGQMISGCKTLADGVHIGSVSKPSEVSSICAIGFSCIDMSSPSGWTTAGDVPNNDPGPTFIAYVNGASPFPGDTFWCTTPGFNGTYDFTPTIPNWVSPSSNYTGLGMRVWGVRRSPFSRGQGPIPSDFGVGLEYGPITTITPRTSLEASYETALTTNLGDNMGWSYGPAVGTNQYGVVLHVHRASGQQRITIHNINHGRFGCNPVNPPPYGGGESDYTLLNRLFVPQVNLLSTTSFARLMAFADPTNPNDTIKIMWAFRGSVGSSGSGIFSVTTDVPPGSYDCSSLPGNGLVVKLTTSVNSPTAPNAPYTYQITDNGNTVAVFQAGMTTTYTFGTNHGNGQHMISVTVWDADGNLVGTIPPSGAGIVPSKDLYYTLSNAFTGGVPPPSKPVNLVWPYTKAGIGANNFTGTQSVAGDISFTGTLTGGSIATATLTAALDAAGGITGTFP